MASAKSVIITVMHYSAMVKTPALLMVSFTPCWKAKRKKNIHPILWVMYTGVPMYFVISLGLASDSKL
jgi:hypothetical protein